mmetsp:Transcript_41012/g.112844  ORF Transcript_41012/g.112844 Transcript_41012/m.112844 type:complete len:344 (-) Transcript_41012:289-1320(-)
MSAGQPPPGDVTGGATADVKVGDGPTDTVSCLAWSPQGLLAAGSWDRGVRVWEVASPGEGPLQIEPRMTYQHDEPVLCCDFSSDGQHLVSAGCDSKVRVKVLQTQQEQVIGSHEAPVREVRVLDDANLVVSGSWDKTLRFWSTQQPTAVMTFNLPERVYAMDVAYPLLVVGCANRHVLVYDLTKVQHNPAPVHQGFSALKMQTRSISCFPDGTGYALGSIEGRCSVSYVGDSSKSFSFKCYKKHQEDIYPINAIDFHPKRRGVFATAGGDGVFSFWERENRQWLKAFESCKYPITAGKFDSSGQLFAYAVSYDWSRGPDMHHAQLPKEVFVHRCLESELQKMK